MIYYTKFIHEGEAHVAFGERELLQAVYVRPRGEIEYQRKGTLFFPSWLKFTPTSEFTFLAEGTSESVAELEEKFGIAIAEEETAV